MSETVFLTGLPRSGSTLVSNLLGNHPDIFATPSSPLANIVGTIRETYSNDQFFMSQLDDNYDYLYEKIGEGSRAYIEAWQDKNHSVTIDKNRGWLHQAEVIRELYPKFKMIVTLRDLRHVYASMERRHRQTALISPLGGGHQVDSRAASFFDKDNGICGSALTALQNLKDIPNIIVGTDLPHLFFLRYEDLMNKPQEVMSMLFDFVGVDDYKLDFNNIKQVTNESDSHYRFKYMHKIKPKLEPASQNLEDISPSIVGEIAQRYAWFYRTHYPEYITEETRQAPQPQQSQQGEPPRYQNDQYNTDELDGLLGEGKKAAKEPAVEFAPELKKQAKKKVTKKKPTIKDATVTKDEDKLEIHPSQR